jgi:pyruvate-ferredoxin/flavodoxin oxidoreductase
VLTRTHPEEAEHLMKTAQEMVNLRWKNYEELATLPASDFTPVA